MNNSYFNSNTADFKYYEKLLKKNLNTPNILHQVIDDLVANNMKNSIQFINDLADNTFESEKRVSEMQKCHSGLEIFKTNGSYHCKDINECKVNPNPCDVNAQCINEFGSFKCKCLLGFIGDGRKGF